MPEDLLKFTLLGEKGTGKTTLYSQLIRGEQPTPSSSTVGFEFNDKRLTLLTTETSVTVQPWDTPPFAVLNQMKDPLKTSSLKGSHAFIIVVDAQKLLKNQIGHLKSIITMIENTFGQAALYKMHIFVNKLDNIEGTDANRKTIRKNLKNIAPEIKSIQFTHAQNHNDVLTAFTNLTTICLSKTLTISEEKALGVTCEPATPAEEIVAIIEEKLTTQPGTTPTTQEKQDALSALTTELNKAPNLETLIDLYNIIKATRHDHSRTLSQICYERDWYRRAFDSYGNTTTWQKMLEAIAEKVVDAKKSPKQKAAAKAIINAHHVRYKIFATGKTAAQTRESTRTFTMG